MQLHSKLFAYKANRTKTNHISIVSKLTIQSDKQSIYSLFRQNTSKRRSKATCLPYFHSIKIQNCVFKILYFTPYNTCASPGYVQYKNADGKSFYGRLFLPGTVSGPYEREHVFVCVLFEIQCYL